MNDISYESRQHYAAAFRAWKPNTVEEFLREPPLAVWYGAQEYGWRGPNGSTVSLDKIFQVRIGVTSSSWLYSALPANFHDWLYFLIAHFHLGPEYRRAADKEYRDRCRTVCRQKLKGWKLQVAYRRCTWRYLALRIGGWAFLDKKKGQLK